MRFIDPNEFSAASDSQCIQAAVDKAAADGCNRVVIPAFNKRTGKNIWIIEETIMLPSHMCVEIDNAHLRMADGVMCRMFQNANAEADNAGTPEGQQEDITIQGRGNALLDGGKHNGLREDTHNKNGLPSVYNNLTIYLHNVRNFKIDGLTIRDQRFWAITMSFAWEGVVSNIHFEITDKSWRKGHPLNPEHPWRNQDGIDLRSGCHDIEISNITGETGDDVIAFTALTDQGRTERYEDTYYCHHLSPDICNVKIRNVHAFNNHCAIVRLLCHYGNQIYNISMDEIVDTTPDSNPIAVAEGQRTACCVKVGENGYHRNDPALGCKPGQLRDIRINQVFSNAFSAVNFNCNACDVQVRDVHVGQKGIHAVSASLINGGVHRALDQQSNLTYLENVLIDGVIFQSAQEEGVPFFFNNLKAKNVKIRNAPRQVTTIQPRTDSQDIIWE